MVAIPPHNGGYYMKALSHCGHMCDKPHHTYEGSIGRKDKITDVH
jgi:hypothetical protein